MIIKTILFIILGIVGELGTIAGSFAIMFNGTINSMLEIAKKGYKFKKNELDEYLNNNNKEKANGFEIALRYVLFLIPGVNFLNAVIKSHQMKAIMLNDPTIKKFLIPMTDKEKEQYSKMKGKIEKLKFTAVISGKENDDEEFFGFIGDKAIVVDHGLTSIYNEKLIPLDYTLDEVKELNEATTYSYRIGTIGGKNIAIIGIPNQDSPVKRIQFKSEDYKMTHTYNIMTEEEAQDKKFIVYPYTTHNEEAVQKIIEKIKQARINRKTKSEEELAQKQPIFEEAYVPMEIEEPIAKGEYVTMEIEEPIVEEEQGPVLRKSIFTNGNKIIK